MPLDIQSSRTSTCYSRKEYALRILWGGGRWFFRISPRPCFGFRRWLLRCFGAKIGRAVHIYPSAIIYYPWNLEIGDESSIGEWALVYNLGAVKVGKRTTISQRVHLCAGTHDYRDRAMPLQKPPILIGDEVWVCADAFVGPSVSVGDRGIVGAASVVMKDVKASEIATAFHATAQSEADSIRRLGFKQPIAVIPNGIVLPDVIGSSPTPHAPRSMAHKRTALFLSRINPKKGLPMLLDAWAKVAPADWRLIMAGNDDSNHLPVVERKIRDLGLSDQVEISGPLFGEAQKVAYCNADLFVLPSYSENFGIVVAEALSFGVPVLTTTGCPWEELVAHRCGWWVEPTVDGIQGGLASAMQVGGAELKEMGMRGRALVEEKYQWPGIAERMLEFYEWVLHGGKQPDFVV